jgi:zinc protease
MMLRPFALLTATALALAPTPILAQRSTLERVVRQQVLDNGLEVIVVENRSVPLATIEVVVKNGSFTQEDGEEGVPHLFEHMIFRGYRGSDGGSFLDDAGTINAGYNGTTQEEHVTYYLTLPSRNLGRGMEILARAIRAPRFDQETLNRERQVVLGEYERQTSNPLWHLRNEMTKHLYGSSFGRKNTIGSRESLTAATPELLNRIYQRYYVPNNTALLVTGDVEASEVFDLARQHWGGWQRREDPFRAHPIPAVPAVARDRSVTVQADVNDVVILLQWQGPSAGQDVNGTYAADVFSDVMNQPASTLQQRLVDSGLFQGLNVHYYTLDQNGPITISGTTTADKLRPALAALREEIEKFDDPGYFSDEELEVTKKQRIVETVFGLERTSELAHTMAFWWAVVGLEYYMGYVDAMAAQKAENLREYARRYIIGKPKVVGVLVSPQLSRQIEPVVQEFVRVNGTE